MAKRRQESQYEIVDDDSSDLDSDMDDGEGLEADISPDKAQAHSKTKSDKDLFDDLPNGIKFKDAPEPEDEDESEEDDEDEEEPEEEEGEPEDEPAEDSTPTGKRKFQKRLMRERRLREEAEDDARASNENYSRLKGELSEIKSLLVQNKTASELDGKIATLREQEKQLRAQLRAAIEAGETENQFDLNEKLSDTKAEIRNAEQAKESALKSAEATAKADATARAAPTENRHLTRWMRQHGTLYKSDPVFKAAAEAADKHLASSGSAPNSEEHFLKLNKMLAKRFPEEFPNVRVKTKKELNRRRPPVGGGDTDSAPTRSERKRYNGDIQVRGNKAQLSNRHLKIMKDFGLDPDSPADVAGFVKDNAPRKR